MIRLMLASYTPAQCRTLGHELRSTAACLCASHGNKHRCLDCPSRRICQDLCNAADYADKVATRKEAEE